MRSGAEEYGACLGRGTQFRGIPEEGAGGGGAVGSNGKAAAEPGIQWKAERGSAEWAGAEIGIRGRILPKKAGAARGQVVERTIK